MIIDAHFGKIIAKNERNVNDYFEKMSQIYIFLLKKSLFQCLFAFFYSLYVHL